MSTASGSSAIPSAVRDALRKAALEKAMGKTPSTDVDMEVEKEKEPEKPLAWPNVMNHGKQKTVAFSKLFPDEWAALKESGQPDFAMPDFRDVKFPTHLTPYIPVESDYRANPQLVYDAALAFAAGSVTHLVGWPGTGKSNGLPVLLACRLGLPLLRLGLNKKGMMFDDLIGREAIKHEHGHTVTGHRDGVLIG